MFIKLILVHMFDINALEFLYICEYRFCNSLSDINCSNLKININIANN